MTRCGCRVAAEHLTVSFHMSHLCANVRISVNDLAFCQPNFLLCHFFHFPKGEPCWMAVEKLLALMIWPYHFNFLFLMMVIKSLSFLCRRCQGWFCHISFLILRFFAVILLLMSKIPRHIEKSRRPMQATF